MPLEEPFEVKVAKSENHQSNDDDDDVQYRCHYSDVDNRPFAGSHSRGTKPPCWRTIVGFVPREWLATKGLL